MINKASPSSTTRKRRIQILTLGEPSTGKTTLIKCFSEKRFESRYLPTIGVDFGVKDIHDSLQLLFWDLAGNEECFLLSVRKFLLYECTKDHTHFQTFSTYSVCEFHFFSVSGGADYLQVRNEFYGDAECAILVYDTSDRKTFAALTKWIVEAENYGMNPKNTKFFLCANKCDLLQQVPEEKAKRFAASNNMQYFEVSSKMGDTVDEMFNCLLNTII